MSTVAGAGESLLNRLALTYGTRYPEVLDLLNEDPSLGQPLGTHCSVTGAEILYATRRECALSLPDALIRRTEAGSAGHPGADAVSRASAIMARELGWDDRRSLREIDAVTAFYRLGG